MNIILTGFMGTGKTSVGKRLAKRLGWKFVDVDQLIEQSTHIPIARIFAERGEPVFRRLERRAISRVIHGRQQVIATGGGAFIDPYSRSKLRVSGPVICLTARPRTILDRVGRKLEARPLLRGANPLSTVKRLLAQRLGAYAQADLAIETDECSVPQVVERIWEQLSPYLCCKSWQYLLDHTEELSARYGGKYVVVINDRIVASGQTQLEAYQNACLPKPKNGRARVVAPSAAGRRPGAGKSSPSKIASAQEAGIYYIPLPEESLTAL